MTQAERKRVYDMYGGHCAYCGCELTLGTMQIDHIEPKLRGTSQEWLDRWSQGTVKGRDAMANYFPACRACNIRKGCLDIETFRRELEACHGRMLRDNANYRQLVRYGQIQLVNEGKVTFRYER